MAGLKPTVTLEDYEIRLAAEVGISRRIESLRGGESRHRAGQEQGEALTWQQHIEGALGEMAFAKWRNLYWSGSVNTFQNGGDVGAIQVRTGSKPGHRLIIRESDKDEDVFVLLTGRAPTYTIHGWIRGRDAKRPEWRTDPGGHGIAFFVPQEALHALRAEVGRERAERGSNADESDPAQSTPGRAFSPSLGG